MSIISRARKAFRAAWEYTFYEGAAFSSSRRTTIYTNYGTDHGKLLSEGDREVMLSHSRKLVENVGSIKGAVHEIATYSVGPGWVPQYRGQDKAWGDKAEAWLWEWLKICDVRGQPFDFQNDLYCGSIALDRDGDFGLIPTYVGNKYPAIRFVESHQIGSRTGQVEVKTGPYAGMKINNGVVYNSQGRAVAFQVKGESKENDKVIPSQSFIHVFDPGWFSQRRGVPSVAHAINDIADIEDIRNFEKWGVKAASSVGLIEENETGDDDARNYMNRNGDTGADGTTLEKLEGGAIWKFKAGSGCNIKPFESSRTHPNVIALLEYLNRGAFAGMAWPLEFSWDPTKLGGANIRLIVAKANRTIIRRQKILTMPAKRIVYHGLTNAMQLGLIPQSNDWWNWDFQMPQKLTVDAGRESQGIRDDYAAGLTTLSEIFGSRGLDWMEQLDQYAREKQYAASIGLKFESKNEQALTEDKTEDEDESTSTAPAK